MTIVQSNLPGKLLFQRANSFKRLKRFLNVLPILLVVVSISACVTTTGQMAALPHTVENLRFIGEQRIPLKHTYEGTVVGGLSGLDYDPRSGNWILESDDRSDVNAARFYTAKLDYDQYKFSSVTLTGVNFFKQEDGSVYPNIEQHAAHKKGMVPDIESIRFDPLDSTVWYASEGNRKLDMHPFVRHAQANGSYLSTLPTPAMFNVSSKVEIGSRNNLTFEGLSFSPDGKTIWLGMEAPLYQDGEVATTTKGAYSRITQLDRQGKILGQFAYPLDSIPVAPAKGKLADNGLAELLAINDHQLFAIERSGSQDNAGVFHFYIRIYEIDVDGATDVADVTALKATSFKPVKKRLIVNLNSLKELKVVDNIEGIAWGHKLANGHDSIVLVSDDNFSDTQVTQFLAFEVLPKTR
ncbi:esterase-like activity of phytase family protein [Undibacterium sp. SXout7W]|uniref:esterase-like activity of phytase family protein n=1 Tax=Undibacterium sp. SXout7W TaxID=3413049 RepID=UPI003BF11CF7